MPVGTSFEDYREFHQTSMQHCHPQCIVTQFLWCTPQNRITLVSWTALVIYYEIAEIWIYVVWSIKDTNWDELCLIGRDKHSQIYGHHEICTVNVACKRKAGLQYICVLKRFYRQLVLSDLSELWPLVSFCRYWWTIWSPWRNFR